MARSWTITNVTKPAAATTRYKICLISWNHRPASFEDGAVVLFNPPRRSGDRLKKDYLEDLG